MYENFNEIHVRVGGHVAVVGGAVAGPRPGGVGGVAADGRGASVAARVVRIFARYKLKTGLPDGIFSNQISQFG
jgi:hypothetical protein